MLTNSLELFFLLRILQIPEKHRSVISCLVVAACASFLHCTGRTRLAEKRRGRHFWQNNVGDRHHILPMMDVFLLDVFTNKGYAMHIRPTQIGQWCRWMINVFLYDLFGGGVILTRIFNLAFHSRICFTNTI